ncbi:hypothetical protein BC833DRAFT_626425 [Globomyces pollinis-pini]|nr:hypothetical protein BC833DRAFT_626425 [Globomyces pollinis-pini]
MKFNVIALIQICSALVTRDVEKRQLSALDFYKKIDNEGLSKRNDIEKRQASALDFYKKIDEEGLSKRDVEKRTVTDVGKPHLSQSMYSQPAGDLYDGYFGLHWPPYTTIYFNKNDFQFPGKGDH